MRKKCDFFRGRRGPLVAATRGKTRITIRIDDDLLEWFRQHVDEAGGGNYQTMMNEALRSRMQTKQEPIEVIIRRVVKDELRKGKNKRSAKSRRAA